MTPETRVKSEFMREKVFVQPNSEHRKTYDLSFGGLPFKLRSTHSEEFVQELALYVEQRLQQAMVATKSGSYQSAAVLAALNIAEELLLLKRQALRELERIEDKALRISQELENSKVQSSSSAT